MGKGRSLGDALTQERRPLDSRDRALVRELCYGVLREGHWLEALLRPLLHHPVTDIDLHALLLVGLYQLAILGTPPHAAVAETVAAADQIGKGRAKGLVNAVLRGYLRDPARCMARGEGDPSAFYRHPRWWLELLQRTYPDYWPAIVAANNSRPPLVLRVNRRRLSRDDYLAILAEAGVAASPHPLAPDGVELAVPQGVEDIPGFANGQVSVQDAAAQLAAPLLELAPGQRLLDACAAPGGKTGHLLEIAPPGTTLWALDQEEERLTRVTENLARLGDEPGITTRVVAGDGACPANWWDGQPFQRLLVDAPCSATGVVRRHPDMKWLRRESDLPRLAAGQRRLLEALWPLLAPGGILLYVTCSIAPTENDEQMQRFLADHPEAQEYPWPASWGLPRPVGRQILPGEQGMDGFYFARLIKT